MESMKKNKVKCWDVFECNERQCPAYKKNLKCWLVSGTHCRKEIQGQFIDKIAKCIDCKVFKKNMDIPAMKKSFQILNKQIKEFSSIIQERDTELEKMGMELSIGLSETFEALKKISIGDPTVRIDETSEIELIEKLKHIINITAENTGEMVDQFHEIAIGLAAHFDVLQRVSKGELDSRISENSENELLQILGKVTNEMIESISREMTERKLAEDLLRQSEGKYRLLIENIPDVTWMADQKGNVIFISSNIKKVCGYTSKEICESGGSLWFGRIHTEDVEYVKEVFGLLFTRGNVFDVEYRVQKKDGKWIWLRNRASVTMGKDGALYAEGIARDISSRKHTEEEVKLANDKLKLWVNELEHRNSEISCLGEMGSLLQSCLTTEEAYAIVSRSVQQIFPNDSGALCIFKESRNIVETVAMWGESLPGEQVFAPDDCWALRRGQVHMVEDSKSGLLCQHLNQSPSGSYMCVPVLARGEMLGMLHLQSNIQGLNPQDVLTGYLIESKQKLAITVAEQIALALANLKLRETLRIQSIRDPLTGLFNRRFMEESLEREMRRVTRKQSSLGVIMVDIDHFKQVNDTFGHATGDNLLRELGIFLKANIRGEDIACRYGGEEFTLILPEASLEFTRERAEKLREGVKHMNVQYLGQAFGNITISLGVAIFPQHGSSGEAILQVADAALYKAKAEGRDRVVVVGQSRYSMDLAIAIGTS